MCDDVIPLAVGETPPIPGAVKISSHDMADEHLSTRAKARKAALDILYEADLRQSDPRDGLAKRHNTPGVVVRELTSHIVTGVAEHHEEIDQRICDHTTGDWTIERMPRIDRNIARIAVWELDYTSTASAAIVDEAAAMAGRLSTEKSPTFLNGLLAAIARTRRGE